MDSTHPYLNGNIISYVMCNINGHHVFAYARRQVTFDEDELTKANTHTTLAFPSVRQTDYRILAMPNWSAKNHRR